MEEQSVLKKVIFMLKEMCLFFLLLLFNYGLLHAEINFTDQSPLSSECQNTTTVTCLITATCDAIINTNDIEYRISNNGYANENWHNWRDNATVDYTYSPNQIRFKITIPDQTYGNEDFFEEGSNNYIQWRIKSETPYSGMYKINIQINKAPQITILQPGNNGYTGIHPLIQATVFDEGLGINLNSLIITIDEYQGNNVIEIKASEHPEIYNSNGNSISYRYEETALETGKRYLVTIYVEDMGYKEPKSCTQSAIFIVKRKTIVDLIPYPSPFDPSKEEIVIKYVLSHQARVTINIYDVGGKLIKTLIKEQERSVGEHINDRWKGTNYANQNLASGIYLCEIIAKDVSGEHRKYKSLAIFRK